MCDRIDIVSGPTIETPEQFLEWFGYEPFPSSAKQVGSPMTYPCLCGSDVDATLRAHGIAYLNDGAGYLVGDTAFLRQRLTEYPDRYTLKSYVP